MTFAEAVKAWKNKTPITYLGERWYVTDIKEYAGTVYITRDRLNHNYEGIEIEPRYLQEETK
ncbi:hypothetical protein [Limosilactobacillus sp.]|uniref:hypothetical protein n=1 Tax=Limosilactobacillus sp. TaxID=2773925 RepID=UPI00345F0E1C